jgi:hypothetical protein
VARRAAAVTTMSGSVRRAHPKDLDAPQCRVTRHRAAPVIT